MPCNSRFDYFIAKFPTWPPGEGEKADVQAATDWVEEFDDLTSELTFSEKLSLAIEKTTGNTSLWVKRWKKARHVEGRNWSHFADDFIAEATRGRSEKNTTWSEIDRIQQSSDEPTASYIKRVTLTVAMLPKEADFPNDPHGLRPASSERAAYALCSGLRLDHPFKKKDQAAPDTFQKAIEAVTSFSKVNRWIGVESAESTILKRYNEKRTPLSATVESDTIELGGKYVADKKEFKKFKTDFPSSQTENVSMDELTDMFKLWKLEDDEPDSAVRIARTIKRMNPIVARRAFRGTDLLQHLRQPDDDNERPQQSVNRQQPFRPARNETQRPHQYAQ
ncbi:hypothetical protein BGX31_003168, partial [Mortierella sp. GBA43]